MHIQQEPELQEIARIQILVGPPVVLGAVQGDERRFIPIHGGSVTGDFFKGRLIPGGADIQLIRPNGALHLEARYVFDLGEDGMLLVKNSGIRRSIFDHDGRPCAVYFRSVFDFKAPEGKLAWLNDSIFLGSGQRIDNEVRLTVFQVN